MEPVFLDNFWQTLRVFGQCFFSKVFCELLKKVQYSSGIGFGRIKKGQCAAYIYPGNFKENSKLLE